MQGHIEVLFYKYMCTNLISITYPGLNRTRFIKWIYNSSKTQI